MSERVCSVAIITVSDRASQGIYEDKSGPAAENWLRKVISSPIVVTRRIIPDGRETVANVLRELADVKTADLVLVSGGTGPAPRDQTPEAFGDIVEKRLDGFGEAMRQANLREVPTAILSRQEAGIRGRTLFITLPGKPAAIATSLAAVFGAVPYCLDLIGAASIEVDQHHCQSFRPEQ